MDFEEGGTGPLLPSAAEGRCSLRAHGHPGGKTGVRLPGASLELLVWNGCGACKMNGLLFDLCYHRTFKARWLQTGWNHKKKSCAAIF